MTMDTVQGQSSVLHTSRLSQESVATSMQPTISAAYTKPHQILHFDPKLSAYHIPNNSKVITMSDIHVGMADRGSVAGHLDYSVSETQIDHIITRALMQADHVVLNGDVFETIYRPKGVSTTEAIANYMDRLDNWVATAKGLGSQLHITTGNHDVSSELMMALGEKALEHANILHFHPVGLRINDTIFVHGNRTLDGEQYGSTSEGTRIADAEQSLGANFTKLLPEPAHQTADDFIQFMKGIAQPLWHKYTARNKPESMAQEVSEGLKTSPLLKPMIARDGQQMGNATTVITGHTHLPYSNIEQEGLHFSNTGTLVDTRLFNPLSITMTEKGAVVEPVNLLHGILNETQQAALDRAQQRTPAPQSHAERLTQAEPSSRSR